MKPQPNAESFFWSMKELIRTDTSSKYIWDKVFKNGPSKICGKQPLKTF